MNNIMPKFANVLDVFESIGLKNKPKSLMKWFKEHKKFLIEVLYKEEVGKGYLIKFYVISLSCLDCDEVYIVLHDRVFKKE